MRNNLKFLVNRTPTRYVRWVVYQVILISMLDYGNKLLYGISLTVVLFLQTIQSCEVQIIVNDSALHFQSNK